MAKVTQVKARKDYPQFGIKKGDIHYTWALFRRPQQRSLKAPRPSQLTGSSFLSQAYSIQEQIEDYTPPEETDLVNAVADLKESIENWTTAIQELSDDDAEEFEYDAAVDEMQAINVDL